jgi:DNA modification methylase
MTEQTTTEVEVVEGEITPGLIDLMEHEKVIEQGLGTFVDVGWALLRISDGEKYKHAGYKNFRVYLADRWGMQKSQAYRLMEAAQTAAVVSPAGDSLQPLQERQMRELAPLRDEPDKAREIWENAVEAAKGEQPSPAVLRNAVAEVLEQPATPAPIGKAPHPAPFSNGVLRVIADLLEGATTVLDPFAGVGGIHKLVEQGFDTTGVEIEKDWAEASERTQVGNALKLKFDADSFDAIATSPTYGNRLADDYDASDPQARSSYRFDLGHALAPNNSGGMKWGAKYRSFHEKAWAESYRVLKPGGRFVLNMKDHIREGVWQDVAGWHVETLVSLGLRVIAVRPVVTRGINRGENAEARTEAELVIAFIKPKPLADAG